MSKRLQVVLGDLEFQRYERTAQSLGLTLSDWVREALRTAERRVASGDGDDKLAAVRSASQHRFPAPDIDTLLTEIEQGYHGSAGP